jgi:putative FmdB family regulatory protein
MPIYEFRCTECQHELEYFCSILESSTSQRRCMQCDGVMTRLISPSSFVLKGTGWTQPDRKGL